MSPFSRRDFLRAGLTGSALLLPVSLRATPAVAPAAPRREPGRARNLIFLVADGMSLGTLTLAERYRRRQEGRGMHWLSVYDRPDLRRALMDTSSASSLVTDSAAASSAWGCGHKVKNGAINMSPDGQSHRPILPLARDAGKATGVVTTATVTHATPAGFTAQAAARVDELEIATQYLGVGLDVYLGGGAKFFAAGARSDKRDLFGDFARAGYAVVRDAAGLRQAAGAPRLLGIFADGHLPYELDRRADPALAGSVPTLAEMARLALGRLAQHPEGFVVQIEGARVDHAAHANDVGGIIHDMLAFDDAIGVALEFAAGRDDTLVILTSDHGNSNPGLLGVGGSFDSRRGSYGDTMVCFDRIAQFRQTNVWALEELGPKSTAAQVRDRVHAATALALEDDEVELLRRALRKEHREGYRVRNAPLIALGQILANYTAVGWAGIAHTTDYVELAAFGPGSESIQGLVQNNALFGVMTRALGLKVAREAAA
ncbi:alkaline phosphatase [Opitutus sp. ER46]|uniref:alkaline phosphatase n=1 Tax=Opitutus sp. ER46 TaxID=2161864 RepID=UPI000D3012C2|nr:alkaline phosphatase [Opitutus sp. ER46]PTX91682.1 alkaline phosphatase [Opitutus sp. ER46]